jgi:dipeptidyl aminopeptidase/acylaminoacyl peptidase
MKRQHLGHFLPNLLVAASVLALLGSVEAGAEKAKRHKGLSPTQIPSQDPLSARGQQGAKRGAGKTATPPQRFYEGPKDADASARIRCAQEHPIETYVQISSASRPQADKKGGVFFVSDLRETPQVFHLMSPKAWPEQITFFPDGVPFYGVSPNGRRMLVATHVGGDEQYDIHLYDVTTRAMEPVIVDRSKRVQSIAWGPTSDWFVFTSNERNKTDFDLYKYDLKTKTKELLSEIPGYNEVTDVSTDGKWIALTQTRSITDSDILLWNVKEKKLTNVTSDPEETSYRSVGFTVDNNNLFFMSDANKGVTQLFLMSLGDTSARKPVTSGAWEVEDVGLNTERDGLVVEVNEEGYSRLTAFQLSPSGARVRMIPVPASKYGIFGLPSFSRANGRWSFFYTHTSSTQTADVWLWNESKSVQWTSSTHGQMDPRCFAREELVHYPTFDKRPIPAFLYLPKDYPSSTKKAIPFVVYVHGGPEGQTRPYFSRTFQYLLQRGFGIFAPNIRGSTGYGKDYQQLDNYKKRMDSVKDVVEGAQWLVSSGYSKQGQMAIYGGSYGGFLVLRTIEVAPEQFSAASASVGISNFVTFLQNTKPYRRALREVEYGPLSDEEFLKSISPIHYIEKIQTPLLIFHGANDPRVPVGESEQIVEELKRREIPVDFKVFADEGHGNTKLRNIMEQSRQMVFFFEKFLMKKGS